MIYCKKCGGKISPGMKFCPSCGLLLKGVFSKNLAFRALAGATALFLAVYVLLPIVGMTAGEKYACKIIKELKSEMLDPQSFEIFSDIVVIEYMDESGGQDRFLYVDCGARNIYGGMVRDTYMYKNFQLVGTFRRVRAKPTGDDTALALLKAKRPYLAWRASELSGTEVEELLSAEIIPKERVCHVLN